MKKFAVGVLGATGMVGQRFITLLHNHPWFSVVAVAASPQSAGKKYKDVVKEKWNIDLDIPKNVENLVILAVEKDMQKIAAQVDFVFCCLDLEKEEIKKIEDKYAALGVPVVSNNSANRWTKDVPMIMPEINSEHIKLIDLQRKNRGWKKGFIVVKPNCSIQSYVSILTALKEFQPTIVQVVSMQAISGAGKTFKTWPEMVNNVIPFIGGEEEKSEKEPLKIWGKLKDGEIAIAQNPQISATCIRVPASDGHMGVVSVIFAKKPSREQILKAVKAFDPLKNSSLPSKTKQFITYFDEENFPQTNLHRNIEKGMGISMGRLQEDKHFDYKFIALSHNTIRGAAGGAILTAELLVEKGYLQ